MQEPITTIDISALNYHSVINIRHFAWRKSYNIVSINKDFFRVPYALEDLVVVVGGGRKKTTMEASIVLLNGLQTHDHRNGNPNFPYAYSKKLVIFLVGTVIISDFFLKLNRDVFLVDVAAIVDYIDRATSTIYIMIYGFHSRQQPFSLDQHKASLKALLTQGALLKVMELEGLATFLRPFFQLKSQIIKRQDSSCVERPHISRAICPFLFSSDNLPLEDSIEAKSIGNLPRYRQYESSAYPRFLLPPSLKRSDTELVYALSLNEMLDSLQDTRHSGCHKIE
ncbi:hypothetical protein Tco_0982313 [Tanacetum coccineum]